MKLNTDILYDNLSQFMPIERIGPPIPEFVLSRPQFFLKDTKPEQHQVYIARASALPYQCALSDNSLLICVGGPPPHSYRWENRTVFLINNEPDILTVFNHVNEIYNRYEAWEKRLEEILDYDADIAEMIQVSAPFFNNRLIVHNNFQILTMMEPQVIDGKIWSYNNTNSGFMTLDLLQDWVDDFLRQKEHKDAYYCVSPVGFQYYCNNLFVFGQYEGGVLIQNTFRPFRPSDAACLHFLARYIEAAMSQHAKINNEYLVSIKSVIADLLDYYPISKDQAIKAFRTMGPADLFRNNDKTYICFVMRPELNRTLPAEYFCRRIENMFETCVSLIHDNNIVSCAWLNEKGLSLAEIEAKINMFANESTLKVGISNRFADIIKIREYYKQALAAFNIGLMLEPDKSIYNFADYMLPYILLNSTSELSIESICPDGLLKLYTHRDSSGVDYWQTLITYLENDNNASQTAKDLYLHRNSLYRRLEHIYSLVDVDFHDSGQIFFLRFCVKVLELHQALPAFAPDR